MAKTIESRAVGVDCGTAFFQTAERNADSTLKLQIIRNAFVEMFSSEDIEETLKRNGWNYIKDEDNFYVVGEDAVKVARMFPGKVEIRRPLQDGVLNKGEDKKLLVLDYLVNNTVGTAPDEFSIVTTCVSSHGRSDVRGFCQRSFRDPKDDDCTRRCSSSETSEYPGLPRIAVIADRMGSSHRRHPRQYYSRSDLPRRRMPFDCLHHRPLRNRHTS